MCCYAFWKKIFSFSLAFLFGVVSNDLFIASESYKQELKQKNALTKVVAKPTTKQNCFPIDTELRKPFKSVVINQVYDRLVKEKTEIEIWLEQHPNSSEKEKTKRQEIIALIEKQIVDLQDFDKHFEYKEEVRNQKLLYVEKCYEY